MRVTAKAANGARQDNSSYNPGWGWRSRKISGLAAQLAAQLVPCMGIGVIHPHTRISCRTRITRRVYNHIRGNRPAKEGGGYARPPLPSACFEDRSSVSNTLLPRSPWMPSRDRHNVLISRWIFHQPQTCRKEGGTAPPPPFDQRKSTISARLSHVLHHLALSRSDTKIRCQSRSHTISLRPCWQEERGHRRVSERRDKPACSRE